MEVTKTIQWLFDGPLRPLRAHPLACLGGNSNSKFYISEHKKMYHEQFAAKGFPITILAEEIFVYSQKKIAFEKWLVTDKEWKNRPNMSFECYGGITIDNVPVPYHYNRYLQQKVRNHAWGGFGFAALSLITVFLIR